MKEIIQSQNDLEQIEIALRYLEYDVVFVSKEDETPENPIPHDQIVVMGIKHENGNEYPVRLYYVEDLAEFAARAQGMEIKRGLNRTLCASIHTLLNFEVEQHQELARLANLVNQLMPGPRITLGTETGIELEQRYLHPHKAPELKVVVEMVDRLNRWFLELLPVFQAVVIKEAKAQDFIDALSQRMKGNSPNV